MRSFIGKDIYLASSQESDIQFAKQANLKEIMIQDGNKRDISKEEYHLYDIISACESILDDIENGAKIEQSDLNNLGHADHIIMKIQHNVNRQLNPTNINNEK